MAVYGSGWTIWPTASSPASSSSFSVWASRPAPRPFSSPDWGEITMNRHEPLAQPARAGLGVGRDDDLVVVLLSQGVHDRGVGVGVHHLAVRLDARLVQQRQRHPEPVLGRLVHHRVVDHVAVLGLVLGADHVHVDLVPARAGAHGVDQGLPRHRLVRDYEDALHSVGGGAPPPPAGAGTPAGAFSLNTACTAPGTPYSYGPPTTVGTSSKLKTGGGDETCHSIEWARQGFPTASGPCRHEATML